MIKHIITTVLIAVLALAIVPSKIEALTETVTPPVTTLSREMLFPKLKWSAACEEKYLYNLAVDNVMPNEGLAFTMITPNYYILKIQCDQMFSETQSRGTYEFMEVTKYGTEIYPRPILTFKSQYMNSLGKLVDYERKQITGNPIVTSSPVGISNFESFNFNDFIKKDPMARMAVDPYACGTYEDFRVQKKVSKPTMKAITVRINNTCPELLPTPQV
jgi:hypothetical protein